MRKYGFAYTDSTGYFLITYAPNTKEATHGHAAPSMFLEVANQNAEPVYLSSTAFVPVLGQATYQTITLTAGEPILGDPPEEIKRVAMPHDTD